MGKRKVFVICTASNSGGPETLHQLVDFINKNNLADAYIIYENKKEKVPDKFLKYDIKVAQKVEDSEENILIVPEVLTYFLYRYKNIKN